MIFAFAFCIYIATSALIKSTWTFDSWQFLQWGSKYWSGVNSGVSERTPVAAFWSVFPGGGQYFQYFSVLLSLDIFCQKQGAEKATGTVWKEAEVWFELVIFFICFILNFLGGARAGHGAAILEQEVPLSNLLKVFCLSNLLKVFCLSNLLKIFCLYNLLKFTFCCARFTWWEGRRGRRGLCQTL